MVTVDAKCALSLMHGGLECYPKNKNIKVKEFVYYCYLQNRKFVLVLAEIGFCIGLIND